MQKIFFEDAKNNYIKVRDLYEDEDGTIIYRIEFIDSFIFMSTSLSSLVDNLSEGIHDNGKCTKSNSSLEYISVSKKGRILFECLDCKKNSQESLRKN